MAQDYFLLPIVVVLSAAYLLSLFLVKKKRISFARHIGFWNVVLLCSFLVSCGLGIALVLRIGYGISLAPRFSMLYPHVIAGNVMATVSVFHISWHLGYFKRLFRLT